MEVTFDPTTRTIGIKVDATCLSLVATVESIINNDTPHAAWQIIQNIPLKVSGSGATYKEAVIDSTVTARRSSGRSLSREDDEHFIGFEDELNPKVRVKLCLRANYEHCGEYKNAESEYSIL